MSTFKTKTIALRHHTLFTGSLGHKPNIIEELGALVNIKQFRGPEPDVIKDFTTITLFKQLIECNNYRPISLLSNISKVLERVVPRGNVTKTHEGALLPRVFWSHFREGFRNMGLGPEGPL